MIMMMFKCIYITTFNIIIIIYYLLLLLFIYYYYYYYNINLYNVDFSQMRSDYTPAELEGIRTSGCVAQSTGTSRCGVQQSVVASHG